MSSYALDSAALDQGVVFVTLSGRATYEMIIGLLEELDSLAASGAGPLRILIDESELRAGFVSVSDVKSIARRWESAQALRSARIAVVAPTPVIYGLNRMMHGFASLDTENRIALFKSRVDAKAWLPY
jgi:hypothetical protein